MTKTICGIEFSENGTEYWDAAIDGNRYVTWWETLLPGDMMMLVDNCITINDAGGKTVCRIDGNTDEDVRKALRIALNKLENDAAQLSTMIYDSHGIPRLDNKSV